MDDVRNPEPTGPAQQDDRRRTRPKTDEAAVERWLAENREAFDDFHRWYEEHGSPLDEYRQF